LKQLLRRSIDDGLARLRDSGALPPDVPVEYQIESPKHESHGDYSTNIAMLLAKACRRSPRDVATLLQQSLAGDPLLRSVDIAGPGFINFVVADSELYKTVDEVLLQGTAYGKNRAGAGIKVQVEFVSANPTGPLHIGHGRGAAIGSALARLLAACGYEVSKEYYVNDAGRQMDILALSVYLRYLEACQQPTTFPAQAYQGQYIHDIASILKTRYGADWCHPVDIAPTPDAAEDVERALDDAIASARHALGDGRFAEVRKLATNDILAGIRADLAAFGVHFDVWYSEASLNENALIDTAIAALDKAGHLYTDAGATWFRSGSLGDEKDRVVVRENGNKTYFASDIAYHVDKFRRGFQQVINIWGADHHGYVARVKAAIKALGLDPEQLDIVLVQFAVLIRGGEKVAMSTRSGEFVTLRELSDEVGVDAARFFYLMRRSDQHLDFDLDLATAQNSENPVYYVQYAHARICSVFRQLQERGLTAPTTDVTSADALSLAAERKLAMLLSRYPETIAAAALAREPHTLTQYLRDLAHEFHGYYNGHKVLVDDSTVRDARLRLLSAVRQVLCNGLDILGVTAPEGM
jgi:arginyl-tRNA synthetase